MAVVEGTVIKKGEPMPATVAVGHVVIVQPDHRVPTFGVPHAQVTVSALKSDWPFPMCCACVLPDRCTQDQGLCCYAYWCSLCAHAEIAAQNDIGGLCGHNEWYGQCCAVWCAMYGAFFLCEQCCSCLWAPCIATAYQTQVRDGVKRKYGLPDDELCGSTMTTYLPAYFGLMCVPLIFPNHSQCAAYQMLYSMKSRAPAPECCCYKYVCSHCSPPVDGPEDKYETAARKIGSSLREADHHALEKLADSAHSSTNEVVAAQPI